MIPRVRRHAAMVAAASRNFAAILIVTLLAQPCAAQTLPDFEAQQFDPTAALNMLTDATSNEVGPAPPLTGLASGIEVDTLFGTSNVRIPVMVPPGRGTVTPDVTVRYSSNGPNDIFGVGWSLQLGSIKRNVVHGVPLVEDAYGNSTYSDANGFVLTYRGGTAVLDTCQDAGTCNYWSASSEEIALQAQFIRSSNSWQVTDPNGTVYTFGAVAGARVARDFTAYNLTSAWFLTDIRDTNDNTLHISYVAVSAPPAPLASAYPSANAHAYPQQIDYGGNPAAGLAHIFHIAFTYESRPDAAVSFRNGAPEQVSNRVHAITVWTDGYTTQGSPTNQYQFTYQQNSDTGVSLLSAVSETVASGTTPPPSATFTYQSSAHGLAGAADLTFSHIPASPLALSVTIPNTINSLGGTERGFADVNGDGLPDLVDGYISSSAADLYQNRGGGVLGYAPLWSTLNNGQSPASFQVSGYVFRMVDMNGDSLPDIIKTNTSSCVSPPSGATTCTWEFHENVAGVLGTSGGSWPGVPVDLNGDVPVPLTMYNWRGAELIDLNGDGLPDIIDCDANVVEQCVDGCPGMSCCNAQWGGCDLYLNTGSGFATGNSILVPMTVDPPCKPNIVLPCPNVSPIAANDGGNPTTNTTKQLIDINGDGLPDLVSSQPMTGTGHWDVWLNTGNGFAWAPIIWPAPPFGSAAAYPLETNQSGQIIRAMRDMNGDGLPDYVDATTSPWTVYVNTGAGFSSTGIPWSGATGLAAISVWVLGIPSAQTSDVFDVNGDGIADYVQVSPDTGQFLQARLGLGPRANLLISAQNGLGASWSATYVPSTDPNSAGSGCQGGTNDGAPCLTNGECPGGTCTTPCLDCSKLPFPTCVVGTLTEHSGFPGSGNDLTTQYTFTGGYVDPNGRQFRGFRQSLEERAADSRIIRRQYAPSPFAASTFPEWSVAFSGGVPARPFKLVDQQILDGTGHLLIHSTIDWGTASLSGPGNRMQVHPTKRVDVTLSTSGTTTKTRTRTFDSYDSYNNITSTTLSGDDVSPTTTTIAYWPSCYRSPQQITVTGGGTTWSVKNFTYDTRCNTLTIGGLLAPAGQSASAGTSVTTSTLVYDPTVDSAAAAAGLPTKVYDGNNNLTTLSYACNQELYPCDITNAQQQVTHRVYDLRWGKPTSITDANSNVTTYTYDGLGRPLGITKPLDVQNSTTYAWRMFAYQFGAPGTPPAPTRIDTFIREPNASGGYLQNSTFFDGLGRRLEAKRQTVVAGSSAVVVSKAVTFDSAGRKATSAATFTATQPITAYESAPSAAGFTSYAYDVLNRIVQTTNTDGTWRTADFSVAGRTFTRDENATAYDAGQRTNVSGAGRRREVLHDALGRITESREYDGATLGDASLRVRSARTYDLVGRLISTTSYKTLEDTGTKSTTVTYAYDSFGRRTTVQDPDSGQWAYNYDNVGNLIYQNDPKTFQHLEFCYDNLNRLRCRFGFTAGDSYSGGTLCPSPSSSTSACPSYPPNMVALADYRYDTYTSALNSSFTCGAGKGRLCWVGDAAAPAGNSTGWTSFSYDARGRVLGSEKTISAAGFTKTFTYQYSYNPADHVLWTSYPTSDTTTQALNYAYDAAGQFGAAYTSGETFVSSMNYDRFGRVTSQADGDSVTDSWTYSDGTAGPPNQFRLSELKVATSANTYQDLQYQTYDRAGNLTHINDAEAATQIPYVIGSPLDDTWTYTYDGIGRLTSMAPRATSTWGNSGTFSYDLIGNISTRSDLAFTPDQTRPHHVSYSTPLPGSGSIYQYDADGGLSSRGDTDGSGPDTGWNVTYDIEGRVQSVAVAGASTTVQSVYDYSGARVARIVTSGTSSTPTFYFGRLFEVTGNQLTRHFYIGDRRVAEDQVTLSSASPLILARLDDEDGSVQVAHLRLEHLAGQPLLYPRYILSRVNAAKLFALVLTLLILLSLTPGRVRLSFAGRPAAVFRRVRRGHVLAVLMLFSLSLTPLVCVQPVRAGGGGGGPVFPTYYVHSDHLRSTTLLTCYDRPSGENCANGTPAAYFRYDAYGAMKACDTAGNVLPPGNEKTDLLYTGQRWDAAARLYYYGARFYDPRLAIFVSEDPLGQDVNAYAYSGWKPTRRTDPTGMWYIDNYPPPDVTDGFSVDFFGPGDMFIDSPAGGDFQSEIPTEPEVEQITVTAPWQPPGMEVYMLGSVEVSAQLDAPPIAILTAATLGTVLVGQAMQTLQHDISTALSESVEGEGEGGREGGDTKFGEKIQGQLDQRGWSRESVEDTIANADHTVETRDTRHNPDGTQNNDPATAFINADGSYVVRNDRTGDIVQISDRNDPAWKSPF